MDVNVEYKAIVNNGVRGFIDVENVVVFHCLTAKRATPFSLELFIDARSLVLRIFSENM